MNGEHWRDYFDSNYVGSWDLPKGRDTVLTITKVERGQLEGQKGKKSSKAILTLRGAKKLFAANVTNCKTIARLYGNNPREWVGKQIALYVAEDVDSPQGPVDAIRVRPRVPQQQQRSNGQQQQQQQQQKPAASNPPQAAPVAEADEPVPYDGVEDENPTEEHWSNVLGVEIDTTKSQIKAAYRALVKTRHPDQGGDPEEFQRIQTAYEWVMSRFAGENNVEAQ